MVWKRYTNSELKKRLEEINRNLDFIDKHKRFKVVESIYIEAKKEILQEMELRKK